MILLFINLFLFLHSLLAEGGKSIGLNEKKNVEITLRESERVYEGLNICINPDAFYTAWEGYHKKGFRSGIIAIADFTLSSDQQRFYILDLNSGKVVLQTWVAHGKNSGEKYAVNFSNQEGSYMSSPGFYKVGEEFISPKHGDALVLEGLDKGINDRARQREIIIHGADYVSADFIRAQGRCGRSHGCPALPREEMTKAIQLLPPGSLLYIHTGV